MKLMDGFPPANNNRVTLANWRTPPFNRWAFNHVSELVPSAPIHGADAPPPLEAHPSDLDDFRVAHDGGTLDLSGWLEATCTDSFVVLKNGCLAYEYYAKGQNARIPHIWMSVSKSILGLVAGVMHGRGQLDTEAPLTSIIPELEGSAYAGATVRDALDMRVGILFDEDYLAKDGPIIQYRKSHLWEPIPPGEEAIDLRSFLCSLSARDGEHNGRFHYVSPTTDLLGWVLERASGVRFHELLSETLWKPIQAERDAYITVDRYGAPRCAGGVCAVPRDMARLARLFVTGGKVGDQQVVPEAWLNDIVNNGDAQAWKDGDFDELFEHADMHYRSQWYVLRGARPMVFGVGVFGQHVFVDPAADLVIAKCSSQPLPLNPGSLRLTLRAVEQLRAMLG